ncbi:MAG: serine/threonine protein kinase, partial [Planctomycetes bacterium]|nr:serine/threonine protein kinase [Planctomycetota bacterium]
MPRGRTQTVFVEEIAAEPWSTALVRIYSICGPAEPSYFRRALEINASVPHGALAIEPIDGVPHFVMLHCYPRTTCDAVTISHSVRDIAHWADEVEFVLTGR